MWTSMPVLYLSMSIYIHTSTCGDETLLSHHLPLARTENSEGKNGMNSISLVWKLPLGWAETAGREGGSSRQGGGRVCSYAHQQEETRGEERERRISKGKRVKKCGDMLIRKRSAWECDTGGERKEESEYERYNKKEGVIRSISTEGKVQLLNAVIFSLFLLCSVMMQDTQIWYDW